ncbi:hypothetical protein [Duganella sp. Root198D2]|uniref:hypothetical protein n=1 Tax=Duganella sp. Root198D2 TaxID=1736489 RepID=UPI0012E3EF01|nr:hypothetical protein [Duganella sp. Root198D2]
MSLCTLRALLDYQAAQACDLSLTDFLSDARWRCSHSRMAMSVQVQLPGDADWTPALRLRQAATAHALRTAKRKAERTAPLGD